jgi:hypothetical protein
MQKDPRKMRYIGKRSNARQRGVEFTIAFDDLQWPEYCPALGIKLDYSFGTGVGPTSPSFDRIDPRKGYVPGNVIIVSNLANTIKTNATVNQLRLVAAFYEQLIPPEEHSHEDTDLVHQPAPQEDP